MKQTSEWPGEWLRGVLGFAVLRMLVDGPTYGYAIAARLEEAGFGAIKGGTLYPLLGRLEAAGAVAVEWRAGQGGPGRKYYSLTEEGRRSLEEQTGRWRRFAGVVDGVLGGPDAAGRPDAGHSAAALPTAAPPAAGHPAPGRPAQPHPVTAEREDS
ncbi:PadR family transcriptional regulator [Rothia santali]|uniref:PadR family transcriptional regulator n=1 Tax=Rothia santali TaxID=2949643 RepID=UPI0035A1B64E